MSGFCGSGQLLGTQVEWRENIKTLGEMLSPSSADTGKVRRRHKVSEHWACHRCKEEGGCWGARCTVQDSLRVVWGIVLVEFCQLGQGEQEGILGAVRNPQGEKCINKPSKIL